MSKWSEAQRARTGDIQRPKKRKHAKRMKAEPSIQDPVLSRRFSGKLHLQEDILARAPILTSFGHHRICIENYRSILEYQEEQIRIQTKLGKIKVLGQHLEIAYYRDECMCIIGDIRAIEYS